MSSQSTVQQGELVCKWAVPRLSLMMFLQFFVWGSWYVTLGVVMGEYGLSALIGDAFSTGPIASILSPFFLGMVVDRFFSSQRVLGVLHLVGAALLWILPGMFADGQSGILWVIFAYMLCYMPTIALSNNVAFHSLSNSEKSFPVVRAFGTIGWIVAGLLVGLGGLSSSTTIFTLAAIASLVLGIYSFTLPHTPAPDKGKPLALRDLLCADAFALLKQRHFLVFSICAMLISIPLAVYYAYAAPFISALGFENVSGVMAFGQMSELIFMLLIPLLFRRLGIKMMLLIGMLAWFLRYVMFALSVNEETRWLIYLGIVLHGVCYDFFFVIGFIYTDKVAGKRIKGQAQSLLVLFTYGLGMLIGSQISGAIFNRSVTAQGSEALVQWQHFWWLPAIAALVIAFLFFLTFHYKEEKADVK
ncbi:major facilitator transporter [[Pantoea] beijingensis]|uniref:Major facilitator transporter n=1 Tax=[Pantoea] beijingensis TaxID=1324864 RepID=A0A443IEK1_9GAMM|nr:MFS transporter [[Pantoea] beijingensis]RWR02489.1 major facilitator transporter [[Pantoea] beijingensis]